MCRSCCLFQLAGDAGKQAIHLLGVFGQHAHNHTGSITPKAHFLIYWYNTAADALAQADSAKPCIYNSIHLLILSQMRKGIDPQAYFGELLEQGKLQNAVLICDDISSGVVPIDKEMRLWRDATGMVMGMLSKHSEQVYRLFAGIASQLK